MASRSPSLRDKQIAAVKKILNLNESLEASDTDNVAPNEAANAVSPISKDGEPIWKILIFDDAGRDIISPILRVAELREAGVTLHMHIKSSRAPIPDVPVIYLVAPKHAALESITSDLQKLYSGSAYINFTSSIPRPLLEDFATQTANAGNSENIAQIFDQHIHFVCSDPDLFDLRLRDAHTYSTLNSAQSTDEQVEAIIDRIVTGLFSVVVTMGVVPIIRCPRSTAAELVGEKLDRKLRDHIVNSKDNLFSAQARSASASGTPSSRPVLILVDRNVDLIPMLSHSWIYSSLVSDILKSDLNKITIETPNPNSQGTTKKSYDIATNDFFWAAHSCSPFPTVAEDIDSELSKYKEEAEAITKKTGITDLDALQAGSGASAQHLKEAITLLPVLREKKAILDMHMSILAIILGDIQGRHLDKFFRMEETVAKQSKAQLLEIIRDGTEGYQPLDKLRLFIIWYLSTDATVNSADLKQFEEALQQAGSDTQCLPYIRQVKATTNMQLLTTSNNAASANQQQSGSSDLFHRFSAISSSLTERLKETGVPTGALTANVASVLGGLRNFLPQDSDLTVTKITESIMDPAGASSSAIAKTEDYLYFDPRNANARGSTRPPSGLRTGGTAGAGSAPGGLPGSNVGVQASFGQRRQGFSEAIVFVVGGGSLVEYGNLRDWAARSPNDRTRKRVIYGSSELLNSQAFIRDELERLGKEVS